MQSAALRAAQDTLSTAVVRSARMRCTVLSLVFLAFTIPVAAFVLGSRSVVSDLGPAWTFRLEQLGPAYLLGLLALFSSEAMSRIYLGRLEKLQRPMPRALPFLQTALTILIPTLLLRTALPVMGPEAVSTSALPWLYFPVIVLSALYLNFGLSFFAGAAAAAGFIAAGEAALASIAIQGESPAFGELRHPFYYKAAILLGTGAVTGLIGLALKRHLLSAVAHAAQRDRAIAIFGQHVSPTVAQRLLEQPLPASGESRHVCVLFLDIRNFSVFASAHPPTEVMDYLNTLFDPLITIVNSHQGVVNKFLGDGFMAVFGAPTDDGEPEQNAARCALEMLAETERLVRDGTIPPTRLGIGLHAGESVTGNVGAESRKEYTVIGDTVNIAARIEQATKTQGAQLLISDTVRGELPEKEFPGDDLGPVELKGQPKPLRLHKLA